jgi:hypothetical protein
MAPLNPGVTIQSQDPNDPAVIDAKAGGKSHAVYWIGAQQATLRNVILRNSPGNALHISGSSDGSVFSKGLVFEDLLIENTANGAYKNEDGGKWAYLDGVVCRNVTVNGWGRSAGSGLDIQYCKNLLIEGCRFDPGGQYDQRGVMVKNDVHNVIVRRCWFEAIGTRAMNAGAHTSHALNCSNILYEHNIVVGGQYAMAWQGVTAEGNIARENLIWHPTKGILLFWPSNGLPDAANGVFEKNIVVFGDAMEKTYLAGQGTHPETFKFDANHWYNSDTPANSKPTLPAAETNGVYGVDPGVSPDNPPDWWTAPLPPPPPPPDDLEERVEALEKQVADHEQRLTALEKLKAMVDAIFEALRSY